MQNEIEVMRVIRTPPMGALVVQANGKRLKQLSATKDEKLRQRILAAIGELIDFAGGYDALVRAGVAPALPTARQYSGSTGDSEDELTGEQAAFLNRLERELKANSLGDVTDLSRALAESPVNPGETGETGINLVGEIDTILQRHVAADEQMARRNIHLRQAPGKMLQIVVDGHVYEHPNDIEDASVRQVLKQALKEWESR